MAYKNHDVLNSFVCMRLVGHKVNTIEVTLLALIQIQWFSIGACHHWEFMNSLANFLSCLHVSLTKLPYSELTGPGALTIVHCPLDFPFTLDIGNSLCTRL